MSPACHTGGQSLFSVDTQGTGTSMGGGQQVPEAVPGTVFTPPRFRREDRGLLTVSIKYSFIHGNRHPRLHLYLVSHFSPWGSWVGRLCPSSSLSDLTWHKLWILMPGGDFIRGGQSPTLTLKEVRR